MKLTEKHIKVLKDINASVPRAWLNMLIIKSWANPAIRKLVDMGLKDPEVVGEVRAKLEALKLSPAYSEEISMVNETVERQIDEHITRKVRQAIKKGSLPPLSKDDFDVKKLKASMGVDVRELPKEGTPTEGPTC